MSQGDVAGVGFRRSQGAIPPEWAVVYRLAGSPPPGGWEQLVPWAGAPLDWAVVIGLAHGQGALPRLASLVDAGTLPQMPDAHREQLAKLGRLHAFRAAMVEDQLRGLESAFTTGGIEFLALKGAALACSVYGGFAERTMGDLDVLIRSSHAQKALEVALAGGWTRVDGLPGAEFYDEHQHLPPMTDPLGLGIGLDLHRHIMPSRAPFRLDVEDLWDSSFTASQLAPALGPGTTPLPSVRVPSPEMLLLHACIHFAWSHSMSLGGWKAVRDVSLLLHSEGLDQDGFVALAQDARAAGSVDWTLHLAATLGGVEEAEDLRSRLGASVSRFRREWLTRHFIQQLTTGIPPEIPARLPRMLWALALAPDREGHGGARPWDGDLHFRDRVRGGEPPDLERASLSARIRSTLAYLAHLRTST